MILIYYEIGIGFATDKKMKIKMIGKNSLYWRFIRESKLEGKNLNYSTAIPGIVRKLNQKVRRKHYNFKLSRVFLIGKIYRVYTKAFYCFKKGHGPITIIGKVSKSGNCTYPNTPYYRITKAWRLL